jgi:hypothetical protein
MIPLPCDNSSLQVRRFEGSEDESPFLTNMLMSVCPRTGYDTRATPRPFCLPKGLVSAKYCTSNDSPRALRCQLKFALNETFHK